MNWRPVGDGMVMAILSGDPDKTDSPFVIRYRTSRAVEVGAHWHPGDEHVTVLEGVYKLGYGGTYDAASLQEFGPGAYVHIRKTIHHFTWYADGTIVQVNGLGPFRTFYV
jgi:hypothetical protein